MRFRQLFLILLALALLCAPLASAENLCSLPLAQESWYELDGESGVLTVRLPMENAANEAWRVQIGNERVVELLTCEVIGDEADEYAYAAMWVGSFKSFSDQAGSTVLQFTLTDESGAVQQTRLLHVSAAEDSSMTVLNSVEDSFYHVDADGAVLTVSLPANPSTGYSWSSVLSDEEILTCTREEYISAPAEGMVGAGGTFTAQFAAAFKKAGQVTLTLRYARPWESVQPIESHEIRLFVNEAGLIELLAEQPAIDGFESGCYEDDSYSSLTLTKNADGTYDVEISIYRLTLQDDGIGVYEDGILTVTATDAAGGTMVWKITRQGDALIAAVAESTWDYLPVGESFVFFMETAE